MRVRLRLVFATLALLGFAAALAPALAAPKPHIDRVEPESALPGGVVDVYGTNLGEKPEEVTVTVGGKPSYALNVEPTHLKIQIPTLIEGMKEGKQPIEVTVGGVRANKIDVEILDESARAAKTAEDAVLEGSQAGGPQRAKAIVLESPTPSLDRGALVIQVGGRADLPDGCLVTVRLLLANDPIGMASATVQGQRIQTILGPYLRQLPPDEYWVDAYFNIQEQSRLIRSRFAQQFKEERERRSREIATDRQPCWIGTSAGKDLYVREFRSYATSTVAKLRELLRDLEVGFGSAGRSTFKKGSAVDEAAWEEWLDKKSLKATPEPERSKLLGRMRGQKDFLTSGGDFADAKWRSWLDGKLREDIAALAKAHSAYADRFQVQREVRIMQDLAGAIDYLLKLSRYRSRELYERSALPFAPEDPDTPTMSALQLELNLQSIERRSTPPPEPAK